MSKKCTQLWCEAHFQVKMLKALQLRSTFGSWDAPKVPADVARSTCRSEHVKKHRGFRALLAVELFKKWTPLWREAQFEVKMLKAPRVRTTFGGSDVEKCTPLWREARFQVKMVTAPHVRTAFGSWAVPKVHTAVARSKIRSENVESTTCSDHLWRFRCWKSAGCCGAKYVSKSKWHTHTHCILGPLLEAQR